MPRRYSPVDQAGFSVIELVLVVVVIAVIGSVGWYVWHRNPEKAPEKTVAVAASTAAKPATKATNPYLGWQTYTSPDKAYTVLYPADWTTGPCVNEPNCNLPTEQSDNSLSPVADRDLGDVNLYHVASTLSAQDWFNQNVDTLGYQVTHTRTFTLNGYPAYYADVFFGNPPGSNLMPANSTWIAHFRARWSRRCVCVSV
jgi:prepilin-type N-terminal cleavage/methylation domain-containing protein